MCKDEIMNHSKNMDALRSVIEQVKGLARQYRELTGKPLGITGEVGEFHAAKLLNLRLANARCPGYDAVGSDDRRIQIKARCILPDSKPGQRVGQIKLDHPWDSVALVLMDEEFEPIAIYEAKRAEVEKAITAPGSKARNERGALSVSKFKSIARPVWERESGTMGGT